MRVSVDQAPIVREELSGRVRLSYKETWRFWSRSRVFVITGPAQSVDDAHRSIFNKLYSQQEEQMRLARDGR